MPLLKPSLRVAAVKTASGAARHRGTRKRVQRLRALDRAGIFFWLSVLVLGAMVTTALLAVVLR